MEILKNIISRGQNRGQKWHNTYATVRGNADIFDVIIVIIFG